MTKNAILRYLASFSLFTAFVLALSACSPVPDQQKTLRIAFYSDNPILISIDPFQVYWIEHRVILRNVVESLTDQDPDSGEIIPWLAKSWDISDDALEYTFYLRDDVTFSNGTPFNTTAVKTAFDSNKAFTESVPLTFGRTYLEGYERSEVIDDYTVKIILASPNAGFLQATSTTNLAILAPESYQRTAAERSLGAIIGSGPFILEKYTPEVGLRLVKREGYAWAPATATNRGEAYLDAVEVTYVRESSVRNGQFIQGQVDIVWPRDPFPEIDLRLLQSRGAAIYSRSLPGPALNLYPNVSEGRILSDPKVRLALQKAINRKSYATTIYSQDFPVVESLYDVTTPYFKSQQHKLDFDPQGAAQLLDEAGWILGTDGYRYKNGQRLTLTYNRRFEVPGDILIQDQLRQAGIALQINILVVGEWSAANAAGNYDFHSSYLTRSDPIVLQASLDPRATRHSTLATNAYPPGVREKALHYFDVGATSMNTEERAQAYAALQDLFIDENIAFPIYERVWQAAVHKRVSGFKWTAEGFALFNDIEIKAP